MSQTKPGCPGAEGTQTAAWTGQSGAGAVLGRTRGANPEKAGTRGHAACLFLRISSFESVRAVPQVTPRQLMAYLKAHVNFTLDSLFCF